MSVKPATCFVACCLALSLSHFALADERPIVAVFDIEAQDVNLPAKTWDKLNTYLGSLLAERGYLVVPRAQLKARLGQQKKESYKQCYSQACQIEIGQAVAAQKSLSTQLLKLGKKCKVALTLYDLKRETSEGGATESGGCDEDGIVESLEKAVDKLIGGRSAVAGREAPPPPAKNKPNGQDLSDLSRWENLAGRWWAENGAIFGSGGYLLLRDQAPQDFVFECTAEHVGGPRLGISVNVRAQVIAGGAKAYRDKTSDVQSYGFNHTLAGTYMPFRGVGGNWYRIHEDWKDWKQVEVLKRSRVRLRVEVRGASFKFFVDGQEIDAFQDGTHPAGALGLWVQDPTQITRFSDLRLYQPGVDEVPPPSPAPPRPSLPGQGQNLTDLSLWEILNGRWWMQDGAIHGSGGHVILKHEPVFNFTVEFTAEHVSGPKNGVSGCFRASVVPGGTKRFRSASADLQCNTFNFTLAGTFMPFVGLGGNWYAAHADWKEWKASPALNKDRVRIRIEAGGTTNRFFVDDQLIDTFENDANMAGSVVLWVQDATQETRFYDIVLAPRS